MANFNYQQALDYLYSFINYEAADSPRSAAHFDLRRVEKLLGRFGNPHLSIKTIHVAGTKGKGSTASMVASAFSHAGYKTALYTSPHLCDVRERMRIDNAPIAEKAFISLLEKLKPAIEEINKECEFGTLTTYEIMTALAFLYFKESEADVSVVETGLGGRLDATNVVKPDMCIITTIGLDHTEVLGETIKEIAGEKAGIIKKGVPVVSASQEEEALKVIKDKCLELDSPLAVVGEDSTYKADNVTLFGQKILVETKSDTYDFILPLLGCYQQENAAAAITALELLAKRGFKLPKEKIIEGIQEVKWPGRFQISCRDPLVILDGAHNTQSIKALLSSLESYCEAGVMSPGGECEKPKNKILVFGMSIDKDADELFKLFRGFFNMVVVTKSRHPRSISAQVLKEAAKRQGLEAICAVSVSEAVAKAKELAGKNGLVVVTGSLFVVGEALGSL